jgi:PAS domain S-box-containing protein
MKNLNSDSFNINDFNHAGKLTQDGIDGFFKIFNNSPACMSLTNLEREFVKVNTKFIEKFGFKESNIIGRTSKEIGILTENESKRVSAIINEKGKIQNEIIICLTCEGKEVPTISCIEKIEINNQIYLMSSFLDISKIVEQQNIIEQQHKEIIESINYAKHIQNSIFLSPEQIQEFIPDSFILSKPKNIVSGDFYWMKKIDGKIFIAASDCTGHGVPGALVSIVGFKLLNKFIGEYKLTKPADILNQFKKESLSENTQTDESRTVLKDGMDISLCAIDLNKMTMEYAGAYNPIYHVRNGTLTKLLVDKIPIHLFANQNEKAFTNYELKLEPDDAFYLFSDGYSDQFGGIKGKKFTYKQFQELILSIHKLSMKKQKEKFDKTIEEWREMYDEEQTDDILVIGFKV